MTLSSRHIMPSVREGIARELHKQARRNYQTRFVELKGINDLYQGDLVDMTQFSRLNKGYKFILVIINCFSKYAITVPLKSKSGLEVKQALEPILIKYPMKHFQTDKGTEFFNSSVSTLLKKYNINHYFTYSEKKASIVERVNRTIKNLMWRKFSAQGSYKWLSLLPKLVNTYNNTFHRTIGMKPVEVNFSNEKLILQKIMKTRYNVRVLRKFRVGDKVRVSRLKQTFTKGYWPNWSNEIYTVHEVKPTAPTTYTLRDERGNILKGGFYEEELSKTSYNNTFLVERILKRKGNKVLVRWLGFDPSHDSWIDSSDLIK